MNLLFDKDINNKDRFDIVLLINAVTEKNFGDFITAISDKKDWIEELCCCYFEVNNNSDSYLFETFEGENFYMLYEDFIEYVKLAIIRYLNNCKNTENREQIRAIVARSIFADLLESSYINDDLKVPLIYKQKDE